MTYYISLHCIFRKGSWRSYLNAMPLTVWRTGCLGWWRSTTWITATTSVTVAILMVDLYPSDDDELDGDPGGPAAGVGVVIDQESLPLDVCLVKDGDPHPDGGMLAQADTGLNGGCGMGWGTKCTSETFGAIGYVTGVVDNCFTILSSSLSWRMSFMSADTSIMLETVPFWFSWATGGVAGGAWLATTNWFCNCTTKFLNSSLRLRCSSNCWDWWSIAFINSRFKSSALDICIVKDCSNCWSVWGAFLSVSWFLDCSSLTAWKASALNAPSRCWTRMGSIPTCMLRLSKATVLWSCWCTFCWYTLTDLWSALCALDLWSNWLEVVDLWSCWWISTSWFTWTGITTLDPDDPRTRMQRWMDPLALVLKSPSDHDGFWLWVVYRIRNWHCWS